MQTESALSASLTKREQDVLELLAFGLSNKEIARRLSLGRRTVETHIDHVLRKLDVPTRTRAVSEAVRIGLLGVTSSDEVPVAREVPPNNLQYQLTTFVDRDEDLAELKSLLDAHRLVTVSGAGGVGKTRIATHLAVNLLDAYFDGVWFCDFSPVRHGELVASVVARVLGVRQQQSQPVAESIARALKRNRALLIFDNCEHVLQEVAELAGKILHNCPSVRIVATSRQPLGVIGENVRLLPSLMVPETTETLTADQAMSYPAIALFVDRAQSSAAFVLSNSNAALVADICRQLDGIPLAIELAATRAGAMSVQRLAQSLNDRFNVLTTGDRTALPRHKTLRALMDWSYELLTADEQKLFKCLGIFAGAFGLDAAAAVCGGNGIDSTIVCEILASLTDKSLVAADTTGAIERYHLLESTRAYALDRLALDDRQQLSRRHAEYFRDQAVAAGTHWGIGSTAALLTHMESDLDNYRAALDWALTNGADVELGGTLAGALQKLWQEGALAVEGRYWITRANKSIDAPAHPKVAAGLWLALGRLSYGKYSRECAERALDLYDLARDPKGAAWARTHLANANFKMGRFEEARLGNSLALELMRLCGDRHGIAQCLNFAGVLTQLQDLTAAREMYGEALAAFKDLGDERGSAKVLENLAELEFKDGNAERALSFVSEAARAQRGQSRFAYVNMGAYCIALKDFGGARDALRQALRLARQTEHSLAVAGALQHLALLRALSGRLRNAARLIGYVDGQFATLGVRREFTEQWSYDKLMATLREHMSERDIATLAAEGAQWSEESACAEALKEVGR
jgi:predicted ATPase/DNA-binding CsgD family transcriptional regulator/Tfp pilus assembly protein PilF